MRLFPIYHTDLDVSKEKRSIPAKSMKTAQSFFRESYEMKPGSILMLIQGGGFNRRIFYGVTNGRVIYRVENLLQHGHEFKGTITNVDLDSSGMQTEVLLPGLSLGEVMTSHLQLDGLPSGSIIESDEGQYRKVETFKWVRSGDSAAKKYDSVHFDPALNYRWIK